SVRAAYNIPRDENMKLRDFPTLAHVIKFAQDRANPTLSPTAGERMGHPAGDGPTAVTPMPTAETAPIGISKPTFTAESIAEKVLEIVAEKTGYPKEMLDLDLDLEADLGIDTVKQAEMFASVRAAYNIPRDENMKLRDFPTLAHVIKFAQDRANPTLSPTTGERMGHPAGNGPTLSPTDGEKDGAPTTATTPTTFAKTTAPPVAAPRLTRPAPELLSFDAANKIPRRVPLPVLRPPLALCKSTGVTLGGGSRVIIAYDNSGVAQSLSEQLRSHSVEVLSLTPSANADSLLKTLEGWLASGPIDGVFWLPALDVEPPISGMDMDTWRAHLGTRVKALYTTMRRLYQQAAGRGAFLVSATRLGG
ncbi:MAG TPA: phosphopantetheine-binding protein, partial [Burkholderiales bacterium]|nr:phosphopantetheine-binding protein [Burkholderiales bacterium]